MVREAENRLVFRKSWMVEINEYFEPYLTRVPAPFYTGVRRAPLTAVNSPLTAATRHHSYRTIFSDVYFRRSEECSCTTLMGAEDVQLHVRP